MYPFIQIAVKVFFSTDLKLIIALPHTIANIDTAAVFKVFAVWIIFCLLEPNLPSLVQFVSRQTVGIKSSGSKMAESSPTLHRMSHCLLDIILTIVLEYFWTIIIIDWMESSGSQMVEMASNQATNITTKQSQRSNQFKQYTNQRRLYLSIWSPCYCIIQACFWRVFSSCVVVVVVKVEKLEKYLLSTGSWFAPFYLHIL